MPTGNDLLIILTAACDDGDYGYNCNETCGSCRNGLPCSKTDGECRNGCQLGKQPPHCQEGYFSSIIHLRM